MKLDKNIYIAVLVVIIAVIIYRRMGSTKGVDVSYTIYGSESCPWTVKALDVARSKGHSYNYVDCKKGNCPGFVSGFPTYKNHTTGKISSGFTENP